MENGEHGSQFATERKKSDFRQPSTRFGEMKLRPDRGRIEGHWSYRAIVIYRRVAFVSKANKRVRATSFHMRE
jgi:hypothetical protein